MTQQRIEGIHWPDLVSRFAGAEGTAVFDVPDHKGQPARFQLLSAWPRKRWQVQGNRLVGETIEAVNGYIADHSETHGHWLPLRTGFISYGDGEQELGPDQARPCSSLSLLVQEHDWVLVLDRQEDQITLHWQSDLPQQRHERIRECLENTPSPSGAFHLTERFLPDTSRAQYLQALRKVDAYIHAGDVYQVNYAQRFQASYQGHPLLAFLALYQASPSPCSAYLDLGHSKY